MRPRTGVGAPGIQPNRALVENHRVLLDDVGRRKWDRLPPGSVPWRCGVLPVIRHSGLLGADPRVRALGTCGEPSRPRHIRALGTCGSGLRMAATWPVPPLCQGPRHLQEGAHVPVWGVCAPSRLPGLISPLGLPGGRGQRP